jgi:ATP-dependent helicase YprA (DUF1998 family)
MSDNFDPIELGEHAQNSYAEYLVGKNQRGYQGLLDGFVAEGDDSKEKQLIRSKGPYLEGVPAAAWSDTPWPAFARSVSGAFAPNGLEETIVEAFVDEGFESLQRHQEAAIEWLVDDKDALIAAGTGRGKTEAWFIPILQYALRAKRNKLDGVPTQGIKAVLTYPTKALAQDQLKRFIEYLWLVNEKAALPADLQLTIGVYDGDTPHRNYVNGSNKSVHSYLIDSFRHFELPKKVAELTAVDDRTLETVPPNVYVESVSDGFRLKLREEYGGHTLEFVHLTRDRMHETPPDILLTNPDTINYRLFNVNDEQAHQMFVDQPKFLVFDEVHTYQGLFGAHVSMLVKRLRRLREERNVEDPLRLIGASATIDDREELFQRLFSIPTNERDRTYTLIEETTNDDIVRDPGTMPDVLTTEAYSVAEFEGRELPDGGQVTSTVAEQLGLDPGADVGDELERAIADGRLACLEHLHSVLQNPTDEAYDIPDSPRPADFISYVAETYDRSTEAAEVAVTNVLTLFEMVDYEVRAHVFNWPVDGYYKCVHCHRIYSKPETCDCQGHDTHTSFVTKLRLCQHCGEQVYEAWYCADCGTVRPVTQETEGEYLYASKPECNHPAHGPLTRIYWTPEYECDDCGNVEHPTEGLGYCECGGTLTRTTDGVVCKDPTCSTTRPASSTTCSRCDGSLRLAGEVAHECSDPDCDHYDESQSGLSCTACESPLVPKYSLPWVCTDEEHAGRHRNGTPADGCSCGRRTFVLPAYVDTQTADFCTACNDDRETDVHYLAGTGCGIDGHDDTVERVSKSFGLRVAYSDSNGNVRLETPSKASHALPCYHGRRRNYDSLMRSPVNAGVTMSQYMLRKLADDHGSQQQAKLMSFADSYRDMERMANDFEEPERELFVQQRILEYLRTAREATLAQLLDETTAAAREYWDEMDASDDVINEVFGYGQWRGEVLGQLLPGVYLRSNGKVSRAYGTLVSDGMVDISFVDPPETPAERRLCEHLLDANRQQKEDLLKTLREDEAIENPVSVLSRLTEAGLVQVDDYNRVELDHDSLRVHFVGSSHPIRYDPRADSFTSQAWAVVTGASESRFVDFDTPYHERTTMDSPYFTRTAHRAATTNPRLLLSQVYKGDLPAADRRRIEHEFKHDPTPNFLSTGPAMEIGIDIGDLNSLLLMGTPPNTNAYLQRIGRAGRDAGKSLVTTVSKRNPIDFYYHKKPSKLIGSAEKPVPLNQHNEHVLQVALTWAIMDYIAARYHIPWRQVDKVEGKEYTIPDKTEWNRFRKSSPSAAPPSDYKTFTSLYHRPVDQIKDGQIFSVLEAIVEHDEAVRPWLESLLDYGFCGNCDHIFAPSVTGTCPECHEADVEHAATAFAATIDDVIEGFGDRIVRAAYNYKQELVEERQDLRQRIRNAEDALDGDDFSTGFGEEPDTSEADEQVKAELTRLRDQRDMVQDLLEEYEGSKFSDVHGRSSVAAYVPNIRSFGQSVNVKRRTADGGGTVRTDSKDAWSRDAAMALRELHPYAYVLRNKQGYVVTGVTTDPEGTKALQDEMGAKRLRCERCQSERKWDGQQQCPDCGAGPDRLVTRRPIAIAEVELTDEEVVENDVEVQSVYSLSDYSTSPRSTFARVDTEISAFEPDRALDVTTPDGTTVFSVEYGEVGIVETADAYTASYDSGEQDPTEQPLRLCRQQDCGSVVITRDDGSRRCLRNPGHDPDEQSEVMVGRTFETKGLRIRSETYPDTVLHTLGHGLRLALQRTGGVDIRSLQEAFEAGDDEAFVFESTVGGNGVTDLLFGKDEGVYTEFVEALEVIHTNIDGCDCASGCPECLYQYGCSERNKDRTFSKEIVGDLLARILQGDPETMVAEATTPPHE